MWVNCHAINFIVGCCLLQVQIQVQTRVSAEKLLFMEALDMVRSWYLDWEVGKVNKSTFFTV